MIPICERTTAMHPAGPISADWTLWNAWSPGEIARRLAGVQAPWYVAAGWAIDLFLGGQWRAHEDLEIAVPFARFSEIVRALPDIEFYVPVGDDEGGKAWPLAEAGHLMEELHQTWGRETSTGHWRVDVFREPSDDQTWIFRRDERIQRPLRDVIVYTPDGIPYLCPEAALFFKAKHWEQEKNRADFAATLPRLTTAQRTWLAEALAIAHPGHAWLAEVGALPAGDARTVSGSHSPSQTEA